MKVVGFFKEKFSRYNRQRKLNFVARYISENNIQTVLLVGCIASPERPEFENLIENGLLRKEIEITFSGLEESSTVWPNWVCADGLNLPFKDKSFDLVFSNAVIEHVGLELDQRQFIQEQNRVGKHWIFTTPNRLFPVESHTNFLFIHMNKKWKHSSFTRLLSKRDLETMCPQKTQILGRLFSPTFLVVGRDETAQRQ
jgi:hypothetical protein